MRGPVTLAGGMVAIVAGAWCVIFGAINTLEQPLTRWYWKHFNE